MESNRLREFPADLALVYWFSRNRWEELGKATTTAPTSLSDDRVIQVDEFGKYSYPLECIPEHLRTSENSVRIETRFSKVERAELASQLPADRIMYRYGERPWDSYTGSEWVIGPVELSPDQRHVIQTANSGKYAYPLGFIPEHLRTSKEVVRIQTCDGKIHQAALASQLPADRIMLRRRGEQVWRPHESCFELVTGPTALSVDQGHVIQSGLYYECAYPVGDIPQSLRTSKEAVRIQIRDGKVDQEAFASPLPADQITYQAEVVPKPQPYKGR